MAKNIKIGMATLYTSADDTLTNSSFITCIRIKTVPKNKVKYTGAVAVKISRIKAVYEAKLLAYIVITNSWSVQLRYIFLHLGERQTMLTVVDGVINHQCHSA